MYSVRIREHMMIAHSLPNPSFGQAQGLHGKTFVVDAEFNSPSLDDKNQVIDSQLASGILKEVLNPLDYQNLDDLAIFKNKLTTPEFLAHYIHNQLALVLAPHFTGKLKVTLGDSHVSWASYEGKV